MVRFHTIILSHGTGKSGIAASLCACWFVHAPQIVVSSGPVAHRLIGLPCCCRWKFIPNEATSSVMKSRQLNLGSDLFFIYAENAREKQ